MEYFICILLLAIGIVLVVKGGDWFVDAASWIAEISGIPTFIIGATIVSVATTLPEVFVSALSAAADPSGAGLAIGNAVGSVNCNIALIMGISLIFIPATFKRKDYIAKMSLLLIAIAVLWACSAAGGVLTVWQSVIVLVIFAAFMAENLISAKKHAKMLSADNTEELIAKKNADAGISVLLSKDFSETLAKQQTVDTSGTITIKRTGQVITKKDLAKNIILFVIGAAAIVGGAQLMCTYGEKLAQLFHVPNDIIGVTILAVGTSLPELVTTITAIAKKKSDLSIGNIIGANIIDITLILPICSFISAGKFGVDLPISAQSLGLDFPFCLAVAGLAIIPALIMGKFKRWQGVLLVGGYIAYIVLLILSTPQIALIRF